MPKKVSLEPVMLHAVRYLTKKQVAMRFGVSPDTVQFWIARNWLPATRIGERGYLIVEADLDKFTPPRRGRPEVLPYPEITQQQDI